MSLAVLVIEDDKQVAEEFAHELELMGYPATWICGVEEVRGQDIHGINDQGQPVRLSLADYDLALVDGYSAGKLEGWQIVVPLTNNGLACIGICEEGGANQAMEHEGACCSALKWNVHRRVGENSSRLSPLLAQAKAWLTEVREPVRR